jgi:hypothetical protein
MKRAWSDGRRTLELTPETFIKKLALLVPPPRAHELTYFGLLAPNAKHRSKSVLVPTHRRKNMQ